MIAFLQYNPRGRTVRLSLCWLVLFWSTITLSINIARMDGWRDHGLFYYAPRLLLMGQDVYDWGRMKQEWQNDSRPWGVDPGATMSGFVMPPEMGLLTLPPALAPPRFAYRAIDAWNLAALGLCIFFLIQMTARSWPVEARLLFTAFVLTLPGVLGVLSLGQSTLVICACLCGAFYAFSKQRDGAGGAGLGLALAKFTLSLPFMALLIYRRNWKALAVALLVFVGANLAFSLPFGARETMREYRRVLARENLPGASYDPVSSNVTYMPDSMVNGERLLYLLLGNHRKRIETCNLVLALSAIIVMAYLLRRRDRTAQVFERPLELALLTLASLLLFYHRSYDMAALLIVCFAVIDDGLRDRLQRTTIWKIMLFLLIILAYASPLTFKALKPFLTDAAIAPILCWINCLLLLLIFVLCAFRLYFQCKESGFRSDLQ